MAIPNARHDWGTLDADRLPRHVAVIMDGNRRWAKSKLLGGFQGHRAGVETVRQLLKLCRELEIPFLTIYAFSTENWSRSDEEVGFLMKLFEEAIENEIEELDANGVRLRFVGDLSALPPSLQRRIGSAMDRTAHNSAITLNVAANYGGRADLVHSMRAIARRVADGTLAPELIDESTIEAGLVTAGQPDPDLLIRTSGEARLSNFLLWQLAYTEIYFTDVMWPEFRQPQFRDALLDYQGRDRRFGGTTATAKA
jgi:undecaprenyl diphosphate synthase